MFVKCFVVILLFGFICSQADASSPRQTDDSDRMNWFNNARFGMFIHWGLYAIPAGEWKSERARTWIEKDENGNEVERSWSYGEWIMCQARIPSDEYELLAAQFNPVKFDAHEWVQIASLAGMKYIVFTAKHHDGFSMFDSQHTEYDIVDATPFGRDVLKELADACQQAGIRLGVYYSNVDWHHPHFPPRYSMQKGFHGNPNPEADIDRYADFMHAQIEEILTNYGPVSILWFDSGGGFRKQSIPTLLRAPELVEKIRVLQPETLINNRLKYAADYGTPEQKIPDHKTSATFEAAFTLNDHWGYNQFDDNWKSPEEVIRKLVEVSSKGGNLLLNVGPKADGTFPPESVEVLAKIGEWLEVNGQSIYGSGPSPLDTVPAWGFVTSKPGHLYLHVLDWSQSGELVLPEILLPLKGAQLLSDPQVVFPIEKQVDGWRIVVPVDPPDPLNTVIAVEYE